MQPSVLQSPPQSLLQIDGLTLELAGAAPPVRLLDGVSLTIRRGETLAMVGESGSGKSLTALSILGLLPAAIRVAAGAIRFSGDDLLRVSPAGLRRIRGNRIAMIFQEPASSLHPLQRVGDQIGEVLHVHQRLPPAARRTRAVELLSRVGVSAPEQRMHAYPHQLSGGMQQRVMIAMALAGEPALLIADEPTTALDVTTQAQILALLGELQRESGLAMLLVTHDLGVVANVADRVCVMYAGRIVEAGSTAAVLAAPRHPYTGALLRTVAALDRPIGKRLPTIAGDPSSPSSRPPGCAFHPRCERGQDEPRCRNDVPPLERGGLREVACWFPATTE